MLSLKDQSLLEKSEDAEDRAPCPRKVLENRTIYRSREFSHPADFGNPVLCDFGEARYGDVENIDSIQRRPDRPPEVLLGIPWSYSFDIWMVGVRLASLSKKTGGLVADLYRSGDCSNIKDSSIQLTLFLTWRRWSHTLGLRQKPSCGEASTVKCALMKKVSPISKGWHTISQPLRSR